MQVLTTNKTPINISFDFYGNLYFTFNDNTYQVNIDGKNKLLLEIGDYHIINNDTIKIEKFNINDGALHEKTKELFSNNKDEDNYNHNLEDEDIDIVDNNDIDKDIDEDIDEDLEKQFGSSNKKFVFSNYNYIIPVNMRNFGDVSALYDTYIYNGTKLCFKSNSKDNISYYRLRVFSYGDIFFRIIGNTTEKLHRLVVNDQNELCIIEQ